MQKDLIIVRGLPGSGKSTLAEIIISQYSDNDICSADEFRFNDDGEYEFDSSKIKETHRNCENKCALKMSKGISPIVVDNTFTQDWEMEAYFSLAKIYNYRVHTIIVENRHGGENVHGCPSHKIKVMRKRFQIEL